jgi:hypothetical protein
MPSGAQKFGIAPEVMALDQERAAAESSAIEQVGTVIRPTDLSMAEQKSRAPKSAGSRSIDQQSAMEEAVTKSGPMSIPTATSGSTGARFVTVDEDHYRQEELLRRADRQPATAQILLLACSLLLIAGVAWYFTRPLTADKLFARIQTASAEGDPAALLSAEEDVARFLQRYPNDSRVGEVKSYQDEIELERLERRFRMRVHLLSHDDSLSPVERDYMEAMNWATAEPQRAADMLAAIVDLYGSLAESSERTAQCVELAKRQLVQLKEQISKTMPGYQKIINEGLVRADELKREAPQRARAIWQSIVMLYGDKSWATAQVARAKAALLETGADSTVDERK